MRRSLYVGRFQIFHNGHMDAILSMDRDSSIDEIIIAIGSSQYSYLKKNPYEKWIKNCFTYEERKEMVDRSLEGRLTKPYQILPLPDLHDYPRWFESIRQNLPAFDRYYLPEFSDDANFTQAGYEVVHFKTDFMMNASTLRHMLLDGQNINEYVPEGTRYVLQEIDGKERIRQAYEKDILVELDSPNQVLNR